MATQNTPSSNDERSLPDYPEQTQGSQLAGQTRHEANNLTEAQREELFRKGMQMIYGEPPVAERVGSQ